MEACFLQMGYEGVMIRDPHGYYKNGRSTTNEGTPSSPKAFSWMQSTRSWAGAHAQRQRGDQG